MKMIDNEIITELAGIVGEKYVSDQPELQFFYINYLFHEIGGVSVLKW